MFFLFLLFFLRCSILGACQIGLNLHNQLNLEDFIKVQALLKSADSQAGEEILAVYVGILSNGLLDGIRSIEFG
jgi:hypothetical protein